MLGWRLGAGLAGWAGGLDKKSGEDRALLGWAGGLGWALGWGAGCAGLVEMTGVLEECRALN